VVLLKKFPETLTTESISLLYVHYSKLMIIAHYLLSLLCLLDEVNCQANSIFYNLLIKSVNRNSKLLPNKWLGSKIRHTNFYVTNLYSYQYVFILRSQLFYIFIIIWDHKHASSIKSMIKNEWQKKKQVLVKLFTFR